MTLVHPTDRLLEPVCEGVSRRESKQPTRRHDLADKSRLEFTNQVVADSHGTRYASTQIQSVVRKIGALERERYVVFVPSPNRAA